MTMPNPAHGKTKPQAPKTPGVWFFSSFHRAATMKSLREPTFYVVVIEGEVAGISPYVTNSTMAAGHSIGICRPGQWPYTVPPGSLGRRRPLDAGEALRCALLLPGVLLRIRQ